MNNISDEIIKKSISGDNDAFEEIYKACSKFVYNVAWRIVSTHDAAEEVTQEVFISIYRKLGSFKFQSKFKTWVYRITINTAMNYSKKILKIRGKSMEYKEQVHAISVCSDVQGSVNHEHHEQIVFELLNTLTEEQRVCVVLRNIEGLSYMEIAETLNININTVRSRLSRAREALFQLRKEVKNEL